jgi:hypothetical protein
MMTNWLPRHTIRRLMVAVVIAAFALGGWESWRRYRAMVALSESYRQMAKLYSETVDHVLRDAVSWDAIPAEKRKMPDRFPFYTPEDAAYHARKSREKARRYRAMAAGYERAARYPWLPVAPDLPEPR